jgi:hypothetical protein
MSKLIIEPDKFVTSFDDIEEIVQVISKSMDEPGLEGKNIQVNIGSQDKIIRAQKVFEIIYFNPEELTEEQYQFVNSFYFQSDLGDYYLFLKSNFMDKMLFSYFHELGHIANHEFMQRRDLPKNPLTTIFEASADAFGHWAEEELSQISNYYQETGLSTLHKEKRLQALPENQIRITPIRVAANDLLLWLYAHNDNNSKKVYGWLRDYIRNETGLEALCEVVDKDFLKK